MATKKTKENGKWKTEHLDLLNVYYSLTLMSTVEVCQS